MRMNREISSGRIHRTCASILAVISRFNCSLINFIWLNVTSHSFCICWSCSCMNCIWCLRIDSLDDWKFERNISEEKNLSYMRMFNTLKISIGFIQRCFFDWSSECLLLKREFMRHFKCLTNSSNDMNCFVLNEFHSNEFLEERSELFDRI